MKYLYYIFVFLTVILRRLVFPLIFVVAPFRKTLTNTVFNYHLQNDIPLKRLLERNPIRNKHGWLLSNSHSDDKGYIEYNKVSAFKYYLSLPFWLLLDSDSMSDTYDSGFNETIINKERKAWMPDYIVNKLKIDVDKYNSSDIIGNTFDLGDKRGETPLYGFWSTFWWTLRNPAYNFNYRFNQMPENGKEFKLVIFGRLFGWDEDNVLNNTQWYNWEFGKKI